MIFDVWMRILKRIPNAVLWLLRFPPVGEENILKEARERGVRSDQIIFSDVVSREEHVKRGVLADLFLDTVLYNAHTTACDILWGGTPLLTMTGDKMASRVGASLLRAAGLDELVCITFASSLPFTHRLIHPLTLPLRHPRTPRLTHFLIHHLPINTHPLKICTSFEAYEELAVALAEDQVSLSLRVVLNLLYASLT